MDMHQLKSRLEAEGIWPAMYNLNGMPGDSEKYVIERHRDGRWCLYYSERGARHGERFFATEEGACEAMYEAVREFKG